MESSQKSLNTDVCLSRRDLFEIVREYLHKSAPEIYFLLEEFMSLKLGYAFTIQDNVKQSIRKVLFDMKSRWKKTNSTVQRFLVNNQAWLKGFVLLQNFETSTPAKPLKDFADASDRTKRRRTESVRSSCNSEELVFAASMSCRREGNFDFAKVMDDIASGTPTRASKYRSLIKNNSRHVIGQFTPEEALVMILDMGLSRNNYQYMRNKCVSKNNPMYPTYHHVLEAKKKCYPENIVVEGHCAQVKLQSLLNHTVERVIFQQIEVLETLTATQLKSLTLYCKWGFDGSSGQSNYKLNFVDGNGVALDDSSIMLTSIAPLQLQTSNGTVVWKNPSASSPRYCRPLRLQFRQETSEVIKEEHGKVRQEINDLSTHAIDVGSIAAQVTYNLSLTMIDGRVTNAITDTASSMRCHLCGGTSKEFNDVDKCLRRVVNVQNLQYGMSSLHAWIRCYECCLHISYKLKVRKWQVGEKDPQYKDVLSRKKEIQAAFLSEMGLIIDKPKQGAGNTNDGNTARAFFKDTAKTSAITGVNEELLHRLHVILQTIACGHAIESAKFATYAVETARLYVELYPWYYMPTSVHKLLLHGNNIISASVLPIGQMSEEAQEASNKLIKKFRKDFSRTCSRKQNMEDVFLRLMVHSDPHISSLRKTYGKPLHLLSSEAIAMLLPPEVAAEDEEVGNVDMSIISDEELDINTPI